jgi:hypothetical protein
MQEQLGWASAAEQSQLAAVKARLSRQLLPFRDSNGFRKLLVLLTRAGRVFRGLHAAHCMIHLCHAAGDSAAACVRVLGLSTAVLKGMCGTGKAS